MSVVLSRTVYPTPKNVEWKPETYQFGTDVTMYGNFDDEESIEVMQELWSNFTMGMSTLHFQKAPSMPAYSAVISEKEPQVEPTAESGYEYTVRVGEGGFELASSHREGFIHAFFTTLQLFQATSLDEGNVVFTAPHSVVHDGPEVKFRGIHLCIFPETSLLLLEKAIKLAAFMKYTHVVLEFWGTIKFDAMQELHWPGHAYSKEEIKPLVNAARNMGMQVIPMFNHLGHASASRERFGRHVVLNQNPKHALLFEPDGWTWCLSNPDTIDLLKAVSEEMIELCGPGDYYVMGCDEAYSYLTCDRCRQKDGAKLLADYINSVAKDMKEKGRRVIIWGDALLRKSEWEPPYKATGDIIPDILPLLDRDVIIADWQYNVKESAVATTKHFMEQGFDTMLCPWDAWTNIQALAQGAKDMKAYGVLATTWHRLPKFIPWITSTAVALWSEDVQRVRHTETAGILRKLVLTDNYEDSGWSAVEVDYKHPPTM